MRKALIPIGLSLLTSATAVAHEGGYFDLEVGYTTWSFDRARTARQVGARDDVANFFDGSLQNAKTLEVRGGYNVLGHAHVGMCLLGTGWNLTSSSRGGGGYLGGEVGWHPLTLLDRTVLAQGLPYRKYYDLWLELGGGYALVGQDRAMDGGAFEVGLGAEGYVLPWLSLALRTTWHFTAFHNYILNYDHRSEPGQTLDLPDGSGGHFFVVGLSAVLHFGTSEPEAPAAH